MFVDYDKAPKVKKAKLLPPCRICGEKASGLHYGVNTCEACKVRILTITDNDHQISQFFTKTSFIGNI